MTATENTATSNYEAWKIAAAERGNGIFQCPCCLNLDEYPASTSRANIPPCSECATLPRDARNGQWGDDDE